MELQKAHEQRLIDTAAPTDNPKRETAQPGAGAGVDRMPTKDRIVEEVQAAREALARESDHDLDRLIDAARARQAAEGRRIVRLPPKVPATKEA
jgi:hypothetical protein